VLDDMGLIMRYLSILISVSSAKIRREISSSLGGHALSRTEFDAELWLTSLNALNQRFEVARRNVGHDSNVFTVLDLPARSVLLDRVQ
jgi:hypothetical protein